MSFSLQIDLPVFSDSLVRCSWLIARDLLIEAQVTRAAAQVTMCTWNGDAGDVIGINGRKVVTKVGKNHDLSYDSFAVPVEYITPENSLYTYSDTHHHGLEVQWPGMVLFVQYDEPESFPLQK